MDVRSDTVFLILFIVGIVAAGFSAFLNESTATIVYLFGALIFFALREIQLNK